MSDVMTCDHRTDRYVAAMNSLKLPLWRPGMAPVVKYPPENGWSWRLRLTEDRDIAEYNNMVPDFSDPATMGCLLAIVREVWQDPGLAVVGTLSRSGRQWKIVAGHHHGGKFRRTADGAYDSEAEALIALLEAAVHATPHGSS